MKYLYFSLSWAIDRNDKGSYDLYLLCGRNYFCTPFAYDEYFSEEKLRKDTGISDLYFVGTGVKDASARKLSKRDDRSFFCPREVIYQEQLNFQNDNPKSVLAEDFQIGFSDFSNILNTILLKRFDLIESVDYDGKRPVTSLSNLVNSRLCIVNVKYYGKLEFKESLYACRGKITADFFEHLKPFVKHFGLDKGNEIEKLLEGVEEEKNKGFEHYKKMLKEMQVSDAISFKKINYQNLAKRGEGFGNPYIQGIPQELRGINNLANEDIF